MSNGEFDPSLSKPSFGIEILSANPDSDGLMRAAELRIIKEGKPYYLRVETFEANALRMLAEEEGDDTADVALVIVAPQISPLDLLEIKGKPFDELAPYLVPEETSAG